MEHVPIKFYFILFFYQKNKNKKMNFSDENNEKESEKDDKESCENPYISSVAIKLIDYDESLSKEPIIQIFSRFSNGKFPLFFLFLKGYRQDHFGLLFYLSAHWFYLTTYSWINYEFNSIYANKRIKYLETLMLISWTQTSWLY